MKKFWSIIPYMAMTVVVAGIFIYTVHWNDVLEVVICFFIGRYFGKQYAKQKE